MVIRTLMQEENLEAHKRLYRALNTPVKLMRR